MSARIGRLASLLKMATKTDITLYTEATPNGVKISIMLEELGLEYKAKHISFAKNEQKEPWFMAINPNGRIPAITDTFTDGEPISVFESGSIMQYLASRYDVDNKLSFPHGSREYWEMTSWVMWQMGGLGPMQGQANHFKRYAPETIEYGINRYTNETRRLYRMMETKLEKSSAGYLVGEKYTIADIISWPWVMCHQWSGVDIAEFPKLKEWLARIAERPGVQKGCAVPTRYKFLDTFLGKSNPEEDAKAAEEGRKWVQEGMKADAKE